MPIRLAVLLTILTCGANAQTPGSFELLARYRGLGALVASAVGPGSEPGAERLYLSYLYLENTIEVVAVDPDTGKFQVFTNPAKGESGARCMVAGPDGNMYLGTLPKAHFLKLDTKAGKLIDLGRPSATEQYIWDVAFGSDGRLYGATYPQSKLVRYDPKTDKLEDLGRMDPVEQYAHYVAGTDDGFMYIGIGTQKANIVAYEIATGEHRAILPADAQVVGQARVHRTVKGQVYGQIGGRFFRLNRWTAAEVSAKEAQPAAPQDRLRDGRQVSIDRRTITTLHPTTKERRTVAYKYEGNELPLFRIGFGPDGELYGSSVLPIHLLELDRVKKALKELGDLGGGEIYSFLRRKDRLLMAAYAGHAPLMSFDPRAPFWQGEGAKNPQLVSFAGSDSSWRPQAFIEGPDSKVYIGAVSGYGKLGGPLAVWDVERGTVDAYPHVVRDQSVITLAAWKDRVIGGTTVVGGGGSRPTQAEARLFIWNPATRGKEFETIPVPGARSINDLVTVNGKVYGLGGATLFVFDPAARVVTARGKMPFSRSIYNSAAMGPDGRIWLLAAEGIYAIDVDTGAAELVATPPERITAGFAMRDRAIYFVAGPAVYRYTLPE